MLTYLACNLLCCLRTLCQDICDSQAGHGVKHLHSMDMISFSIMMMMGIIIIPQY